MEFQTMEVGIEGWCIGYTRCDCYTLLRFRKANIPKAATASRPSVAGSGTAVTFKLIIPAGSLNVYV